MEKFNSSLESSSKFWDSLQNNFLWETIKEDKNVIEKTKDLFEWEEKKKIQNLKTLSKKKSWNTPFINSNKALYEFSVSEQNLIKKTVLGSYKEEIKNIKKKINFYKRKATKYAFELANNFQVLKSLLFNFKVLLKATFEKLLLIYRNLKNGVEIISIEV